MEQRNKIVTSSPGKKCKADWGKLWSSARSAFELAGMDRQQAVLENFRGQKEEICRVLNIISEADIARIQRRIEQTTKEGK